MKYIFMHGVKEGLVATHDQWPGLTAWPELCEDRERRFTWPGCAEKSQPGLPLSLARLPGFETCSASDYAKAMRLLCGDAAAEALSARGSTPPLGVTAVLRQHPHDRPEISKRSSRPLCHAVCRAAKQAFIETYRAFVDAYVCASALLRSGLHHVQLPAHAYPPPLPYAWRIRTPPLGTIV